MIETTVHITSYNRPKLLKSCVNSFFSSIAGHYPLDKLELIIVDNGSTNDEVLDFIKNLKIEGLQYSYILNEKNDYPYCLRYAKIQARKIAKGNFLIDIPDDHLFIVSSEWINKSIDHIKKNNNTGCVVYFAQPAYRFLKENNRMHRHANGEYFVSEKKGYADYHIMSKKTYDFLGEYDYKLGRKAESEYMQRALDSGFYRNLLTYPVAIVNDEKYHLEKNIEYKNYVSTFSNMEIPVTNEQLISYSLGEKSIVKL